MATWSHWGWIPAHSRVMPSYWGQRPTHSKVMLSYQRWRSIHAKAACTFWGRFPAHVIIVLTFSRWQRIPTDPELLSSNQYRKWRLSSSARAEWKHHFDEEKIKKNNSGEAPPLHPMLAAPYIVLDADGDLAEIHQQYNDITTIQKELLLQKQKMYVEREYPAAATIPHPHRPVVVVVAGCSVVLVVVIGAWLSSRHSHHLHPRCVVTVVVACGVMVIVPCWSGDVAGHVCRDGTASQRGLKGEVRVFLGSCVAVTWWVFRTMGGAVMDWR
ncbi:hypothetical protein EDB89DRAFT_1909479 [Lactarius sanguifluus]|nr:hypothetical protein EDB89DRAFT_1909479 [Lactarius sanguifluus]